MAAFALRTALRQVEDSHKKFLGALFVIPRLREQLQPATEA
jgi:hypothetical protein